MFITLSFYWALYVLAYVIAEVSYKASTSPLDMGCTFHIYICMRAYSVHLWGGRVRGDTNMLTHG
jgi:hypothetical protein